MGGGGGGGWEGRDWGQLKTPLRGTLAVATLVVVGV